MKKNTIKDVFTELRLIHWMFSVKRKKHFSQDHLLFHKINTLLFFTPPPSFDLYDKHLLEIERSIVHYRLNF